MVKAVVLGVNYYIGLSVLRCLGRNGIYTVAADYDPKAYGMASKYISEKLWLPDGKKDEEGMIKALIAYGKKQKERPVLFPCHDNYVGMVDRHLPQLQVFFRIPQTKQGLYTICMDKDKLYHLAKAHGVRMPETLDPREAGFYSKVEDHLGYPCIVKPDDSPAFTAIFRKKVFIAEDAASLKAALEKCEKANLSVKVQKIVQGFDDHMYTYDAYLNQNSKVTHYTTCNKKRQWPINFGASTFIVQKPTPEIAEIGRGFLEAIGWKGFAEIEFKKDEEDGDFYLIEINVRTTNFNPMLEAIGLNMPLICYNDLCGKPDAPKAVMEETGHAFMYYYEDRSARKAYIKAGQLTEDEVKAQGEGYIVTEALWAKDDPKPLAAFVGMKAGRLVDKLKKKKEL